MKTAKEFLESKGHKAHHYAPPAYIARMMEEYHNYLSEQQPPKESLVNMNNYYYLEREHIFREEPPLELRICTRCGKEFKSNINNPICPSCYL